MTQSKRKIVSNETKSPAAQNNSDPLVEKAMIVYKNVDSLNQPITTIRNALEEAKNDGEREERKRIIDLVLKVQIAWTKAGFKDAASFAGALVDGIKQLK